jgi:hypothetical protein
MTRQLGHMTRLLDDARHLAITLGKIDPLRVGGVERGRNAVEVTRSVIDSYATS